MRPAHKTISAGVWIVREQACFNTSKPLFIESIRTWSFDCYRFAEAHPIRSFFHPKKRKGYISMSAKLYVGNLAFQTTSQELQALFAQAGTVESASVVEDRDTGRSRGFAFVEMSTQEEATSAIDQFNGKEVGGRTLKVNEPNHVKIVVEADEALVIIAAALVAIAVAVATPDEVPSHAGNNQHSQGSS